MRKLVFIVLVSFLLVALAFVQKGNIPAAKAASSIYQGDLVLTGNNVTTIEGRFDINGSIIVKDNATLHLKDAFLNFTQTEGWLYNITLRNPSNGNPRLLAYNSTISSNYATQAYLYDNSTAAIENSTINTEVRTFDYSVMSISSNSTIKSSALAFDYSVVSISDSNFLYGLYTFMHPCISIYNSSLGRVVSYESSQVQIHDSEIRDDLSIMPHSVNCTISELEPGLIRHWNFITNSSATWSGGHLLNVTLTDTRVNEWDFYFYGSSYAAILNSTVAVGAMGSSVLSVKSTTCEYAGAHQSSVLFATDSSLDFLRGTDSSNIWLLNTTYTTSEIKYSARVHVSWYLDVHVIDSIGQDVPSANITATYPNATIAESELTDANGWTKLALMEKMMNLTGEYPVGNYTVKATYLTYSNNATVNMTENKQIILTLEDFIIPEFPSFLILSLFMIATLLTVIVYRRKHHM